jgi:hypothetical protein
VNAGIGLSDTRQSMTIRQARHVDGECMLASVSTRQTLWRQSPEHVAKRTHI